MFSEGPREYNYVVDIGYCKIPSILSKYGINGPLKMRWCVFESEGEPLIYPDSVFCDESYQNFDPLGKTELVIAFVGVQKSEIYGAGKSAENGILTWKGIAVGFGLRINLSEVDTESWFPFLNDDYDG